MTVVARRFVSIPERTASATWSAISQLLVSDPGAAAAAELASVAGVAASLISREAMTSPIVVWGAGPRVRIYCLYNDEAVEIFSASLERKRSIIAMNILPMY